LKILIKNVTIKKWRLRTTQYLSSLHRLFALLFEKKSAETKNILQAQQFSGQRNDAF